MYTASIETVNNGTFIYGFHLGTVEWIARDCVRELMHLRFKQGLGEIRVNTIGLKLNGELVDVFDGRDWMTDLQSSYCDEIDSYDY